MAYCHECRRHFNCAEALLQHKRCAPVHNGSSQQASQPQGSRNVKTQLSVVKKQNLVATGTPIKGKSSESGVSARPIHHQTAFQPPKSHKASASSSKTSNTLQSTSADFQNAKTSWSIIPELQHEHVLELLSRHCHSRQNLEDNGYIVDLYNPSIYENTEKCKNCKSKSANLLVKLC
jgi:hypothetical protein